MSSMNGTADGSMNMDSGEWSYQQQQQQHQQYQHEQQQYYEQTAYEQQQQQQYYEQQQYQQQYPPQQQYQQQQQQPHYNDHQQQQQQQQHVEQPMNYFGDIHVDNNNNNSNNKKGSDDVSIMTGFTGTTGFTGATGTTGVTSGANSRGGGGAAAFPMTSLMEEENDYEEEEPYPEPFPDQDPSHHGNHGNNIAPRMGGGASSSLRDTPPAVDSSTTTNARSSSILRSSNTSNTTKSASTGNRNNSGVTNLRNNNGRNNRLRNSSSSGNTHGSTFRNSAISKANSHNLRASAQSMDTSFRTNSSAQHGNNNDNHHNSSSSSNNNNIGKLKSATGEINVSNIDFLLEADEETSLPESYSEYHKNNNDNNDNDWNNNAHYSTPTVISTPNESSHHHTDRSSHRYVALAPIHHHPPPPPEVSPFSKKKRYRTALTIMAAVALAVVGLYVSVRSVHGVSNNNSSASARRSAPSSGVVYVPGYQFGGGIGGLVGGKERERRVQQGYSNYGYGSNYGEGDYYGMMHSRESGGVGGGGAMDNARSAANGNMDGTASGAAAAGSGVRVPTRGSVAASYSTAGNAIGEESKHGHRDDHNHDDSAASRMSSTGLSSLIQRSSRVFGLGGGGGGGGSSSSSLVSSSSSGTSGIHNYIEKPPDPFNGYGPPQFNSEYAIAPNGGTGLHLATLTSAPLTSYTPPPNEDFHQENGGSSSSGSTRSVQLPMVLDPMFHGSIMDLSILPFNPIREVPTVWDVPLSGVSGIQSIFGSCLKFVQCSNMGNHILSDQYEELRQGEHRVQQEELRKNVQELRMEERQRLRMKVVIDRVGGNVLYEHQQQQQFERQEERRTLMQLVDRVTGREVDNGNANEDGVDGHDQQGQVQSSPTTTMGGSNSVGIIDKSSINFDPPLEARFAYDATFVNVDCTTPQGINRGITHNLATSNMMDVVYSPDIHDVARLFAPPTQAYGRAVVLIRHPLERAVATYEYLRTASHDGRSTVVGGMSLEEYSKSEYAEDNFLTRTLSGNLDSSLKRQDIDLAKEILKRKFIVGLFDRMQDSVERFETFFGWHLTEVQQSCQENEVQRELAKHYNGNVKIHGDISGDDGMYPGLTRSALASLAGKNQFDLLLFDFAMFLFDYQGRVLFGISEDSV